MSGSAEKPRFTLKDYATTYADRHLLHGVVARWAQEEPESPALISADGSRVVSWLEFDRVSSALARALLRLGFKKGDFLATLLPLTVDHILLEYGCFKIGVVFAPLDLRSSAPELIRMLTTLRPRGFVSLSLLQGPFGPVIVEKEWQQAQPRIPQDRIRSRDSYICHLSLDGSSLEQDISCLASGFAARFWRCRSSACSCSGLQ